MAKRKSLALEIAQIFANKSIHTYVKRSSPYAHEHIEYMQEIERGLQIGSFLADAGWLDESIRVLLATLKVINMLPKEETVLLTKLDCLQR